MLQSSKPINSYKHQSKCWCVNLCHVYPKLKSPGFCFSHFRVDFVVKCLLGFNFYFLIYRQKLSGCRLYLWNGHFCTKVIILLTNPDNWVRFFILSVDLYWFPMMVYFPLLIIPECVHVCVYQHHNEGVEQVKQSQTSTIFMYEVLGKLLLTLMNIVVNTNIEVKLTVMTAWKIRTWV